MPVEFSAPEDPGTGDDAFLNLPGIVQEAWYRDAFEGVDLQYLVLPMGVKENLILKNADAPAAFTMEYQFHQLSAVQLDEKTIELRDRSGDTVYTITAPAMQDANGVWSNALTLKILEAKNNKLTVQLTADRAWLSSADRALAASVIYTGGGNTLLNVNYTYDAVGNISTMVQDGVTYTYAYDSLNQLTAVATSDNSYTAAFSYDNGGNLTSKTVNGQTYTYSYGDTEWKDLLTAYNGESITYDQIGNPLNYRGKTLTWTGRRLDTLTQNGVVNSYLYNADGIRTQKTVNGTTTEYFLNGSTILAEKTGDTVNWFIYDDSGDVLGLVHNGTAYYYLKTSRAMC